MKLILIMQPTIPASGRKAPQAGNLGHITWISNKLVQLGSSNSRIQVFPPVGDERQRGFQVQAPLVSHVNIEVQEQHYCRSFV